MCSYCAEKSVEMHPSSEPKVAYVTWRACVFHRSVQSCGDHSLKSFCSRSISCFRVPVTVCSSSWKERPSGSKRGTYSFHDASCWSPHSTGHLGMVSSHPQAEQLSHESSSSSTRSGMASAGSGARQHWRR